jgi:hypothetical protein
MKPVKNKLLQELTKLCPKANKVSLLHLAIAISQHYPLWYTTDKYLLKKAKKISKMFIIEVVDPYATSSGNSFNYYI